MQHIKILLIVCLLSLLSTSCKQSYDKNAPIVLYEVVSPFDSTLRIKNKTGAKYSEKLADGSYRIVIDPSIQNEYDFNRFPKECYERAKFSSGEIIVISTLEPNAKYRLSSVGCDGDGNKYMKLEFQGKK